MIRKNPKLLTERIVILCPKFINGTCPFQFDPNEHKKYIQCRN